MKNVRNDEGVKLNVNVSIMIYGALTAIFFSLAKITQITLFSFVENKTDNNIYFKLDFRLIFIFDIIFFLFFL